jgi:hypothetical protein
MHVPCPFPSGAMGCENVRGIAVGLVENASRTVLPRQFLFDEKFL